MPVGNGRCGRRRDRRHVIDGIPHRTRTGVQGCDPPERCGPWKTVHERHHAAFSTHHQHRGPHGPLPPVHPPRGYSHHACRTPPPRGHPGLRGRHSLRHRLWSVPGRPDQA
ncbi:hypothetical protein [Streptomyces sp. NPDC058664]|uniref:hypothetical protein n=1 Tax=unclassified Streptomyces TaxID=2593676 RepID=UPI00365C99CA